MENIQADVSYGIYFDVNSDKVKPQSAGKLREIKKMKDLKLKL